MGTIREMYEKHEEAALYIFFGGLNVLVTWLSYAVFVLFGIDTNVSNVLSWVCGVLFAFASNKWFVFKSRSTDSGVVMKEMGSFFGSRIITGAIAALMFPALVYAGVTGGLFGVPEFQAKIITSIAEIALNWIFSKYMVFAKKT